MTHAEFLAWLQDEVDNSRMTTTQRDDLLAQKQLFDSNRSTIENDFTRRIVGYVSNNLRSAGELHALLDAAKSEFPHRMVYFEPIGFDLY